MSAVIQNEYTQQNNSTVLYSFTFPYLKTSDIKVSLDGVETTAFTLPNATQIQLNSVPAQNTKIKIFRQTSVDSLTATFYAGSAIKSEDLNDNFTQNLYKTQEIGGRFISNLGDTMTGDLNMGEDTVIKFEGATDDAHETTLTVADPTADRTITLPNVTGTVVTTGDTGTVATAMIAGDAVNGTKIADDSINSEHYVDASIDTAHIADAQITTAKIADDAITNAKIATLSVGTNEIGGGSVTTAKLASGSVTTVKLADNSVNSDKISENAVTSVELAANAATTTNIADNAVTNAKMADDSVGTAELVDGSVDTARLADNSVTLAKMTDNSVGTSEVVDAAVTTAKLASNAVTTAKITDANVTTAKLADSAVTGVKISNSTITGSKLVADTIEHGHIASSAVRTDELQNSAVTTVKIADDAVTAAKIADDAVGSSELGDGVIDTVHVGAAQITDAKLASNAVTTAKITDANVTTAKIANDAITIGKIGCEQTTISDSDSHIPTSGAVVDYVAAQIAPLGGLEVIATEVAFPNTQPSSGVVISISDAGGVVVNGSGVSTTGRTVGGSTVTINGFPASLQSKTMAADIGLMVSSTGSGQVYNYHKILAKEADVEQLSNDINDFAARYRVGSSNPTSSLDNGDLFFNTGTGKMLVYNGTNTAWEEVQSIGNFFISTLSPAFDGSTQNFTLTNAPTNVQQVLLSINGVVQKPNAGSSTPSEGFALDGSTIKLASAPASSSDYFVVVMGSTVNIGTPSNNTVSTAILQNDSVNADKIAAGAVGSTELAANAVITSKIADDAITGAKLANNIAISTTGSITGASGTISGNLSMGGVISLPDTIQHVNDTDTKIRFSGTDTISLETGGIEAFKADSSGDITLGRDYSTSPSNSAPNSYILRGHSVNNSSAEAEYAKLFFKQSSVGGGSSAGIRAYRDGANYRTGLKFYTHPSQSSGGDGNERLKIASDGTVTIGGNLDVGSGVDVTGNITVTGTVDGVDIAALNTTVGNLTTDVVSDTSPQLGGDLDTNGHEIFLDDSHALKCGAGNDLVIESDGTNGLIKNHNAGAIYVRANRNVQLMTNASSGGADNAVTCVNNGAVELYWDNGKKFETTQYGATVHGRIESSSWGTQGAYSGQFGRIRVGADSYGNTIRLITDTNMNLASNGTIAFYLGGATDGSSFGSGVAYFNSSGLMPSTSGNFDLGSSSLRWDNIYTNDLHLSNEGSSNDVDSTWGDWTIQEGESDLFLKNNRSGKKYKFNLTEVS